MTSFSHGSECDYCGLPVAGRAGREGPCYCCSGCRLAASIAAAGGADGQARWLMTRLGLAAFCSMNVMVFSFLLWSQDAGAGGGAAAVALYGLARSICLVFTAPVLLLLGGSLVESALADLRRRRLSIDPLLVAGVGAAFGISAWNTWRGEGHVYFEVACMVLVAVTLGRWLEASGKLRTTEALRTLESLLPQRVRRVRCADGAAGDGGPVRDVPLTAVAVGDVLRILPGEHVPTDGVIRAGHAAIDERTVSGESEPVVRSPGDPVRSGTTNLDGDLAVEVTSPPGGGTLERLIEAVTAAVRTSASQRLADRMAAWFLPTVIALAAIAGVAHWRRGGPAEGVMTALAVVVVACPCALGLATPLALWAAIGRCMRRQVLVRQGDALERLARVSDICLDKTGTLTSGCRIARVETTPGVDRRDALATAAGLAGGSSHPSGRAIAAMVAAEGIPAAATRDVRSVAGSGVEGILVATQADARLGTPRWAGVGVDAAAATARCALAVAGDVVAAFWTAEEIRPGAAAAVAGLRDRGLRTTVLSGDQPARVAAVAEPLGLAWRASLEPTDKIAVVVELRGGGGVAMVGDGINDAAALAAADVGIALGCGADVARWTAPICLLDDELATLPWLVDLAVQTRRTIRWNLLWAFGYNAACIPLATTGLVHPAIAAAAMVASSLLVVANSLRLGRDDFLETASAAESSPSPPLAGRRPAAGPAEAAA